MSIETVNGYVCTNCSEAALAKRGIDPNGEAGKSAPAGALGPRTGTGGVIEPQVINSLEEDGRARFSLDYSREVDRLV